MELPKNIHEFGGVFILLIIASAVFITSAIIYHPEFIKLGTVILGYSISAQLWEFLFHQHLFVRTSKPEERPMKFAALVHILIFLIYLFVFLNVRPWSVG